MDLSREHRWDRSSSGGDRLFADLPPGTVSRAGAEHVERFLELARKRRHDPPTSTDAPEDLYLVDEDERSVREIIGFRLRGHPLAMLGVVSFQRHERSPVPHGRASLASFFSKPPTQVSTDESAPPPGVIEIHLPHVEETIPDMVERVRADRSEGGVQVDVALIDFAFDFRFKNPSAIPRDGMSVDSPQRGLFRTIQGHVLSGVSVGLYKALRKGLQFVTLTDAIQHRPHGDIVLPTLAFNRGSLAIEARVDPTGHGGAESTLAFHPAASSPMHLFGGAFDRVQPGNQQSHP